MPIFYSLVARGKTVLAEFTARTGNFPTVTRVLLNKIDPRAGDQKMSYTYDQYIFNFIIEDGITYLCLTDEEDKKRRRISFAFLDDVKARFRRDYGDRVHTAIAFAMNAEFSVYMEQRMTFFNSDPGSDALGRVQGQLKEVKDVMVENIEKVLARGEKIELLVDKTEELSQTARRFQYQSKNLKDMMWWKNVKMWLIIIFIVLIVIYFIVSFICGFNFDKCK